MIRAFWFLKEVRKKENKLNGKKIWRISTIRESNKISTIKQPKNIEYKKVICFD